MANRAKSEVSIEIGGRAYSIAWTLGAQAEVEDAFGLEFAEDVFPVLFRRLGEGEPARVGVSARAGRKFLTAVLRGCGHDLSEAEVGTIEPIVFADALAGLFGAAGLNVRQAAEAAEARPTAPAESVGISGSASASDISV